MSDFVFSAQRKPHGELARQVRQIYHEYPPDVIEFHGSWGSLAVSKNLHMGFDPVETDTHLCIIIGGPVLAFTSNRFLGEFDPTYGTREILRRWLLADGIRWDEDLSGPFVALKLEKASARLDVVTDLLSSIPAFASEGSESKVIGTHVDMVARAANCAAVHDPISIADFVVHGIVTYPFTIYPTVKQIAPASTHTWVLRDDLQYRAKSYWLPWCNNPYRSLAEAAEALRHGLQAYVSSVTEGIDRVAVFLSGGEDSRAVTGMIPQRCQRNAFIFLDRMNREGRIAQAAANAYGTNFVMCPRGALRDLNVLAACADLVGTGALYVHCHSYGYQISAGLNQYRAVFGGFLSDTLFKSFYIETIPLAKRFPFLPSPNFSSQAHRRYRSLHPTWPFPSVDQPDVPYDTILQDHVIEELRLRRAAHLAFLRTVRDGPAALEWFHLWPISMVADMPTLYGNRRLFASYEPFLANASIKLAAAVPQSWKMNRRLFQKMAQPLLEPAKMLLHSNGWLPYYPWYVNLFVYGSIWTLRRLRLKLGISDGNQGSWGDWNAILSSSEWKVAMQTSLNAASLPSDIFSMSLKDLFEKENLSTLQKVGLMQMLYQCRDRTRIA